MVEKPLQHYKKRKLSKNQFQNLEPSKKDKFQHQNLEDIMTEVIFQLESIIKVLI
jgi:hypothetical protein